MTNYYVTVAGAGDNSGDSWANAMALSDLELQFTSGFSSGDNIFMAGGTYVNTGSDMVCSSDGSLSSPISWIGVKPGTTNEPPVFSDWATGTDRPLIDLSSDSSSQIILSGRRWSVTNLRVSGQDTTAIISLTNLYGYNRISNCYVENTYAFSGYAIDCGPSCVIINCELKSAGSFCALLDTYSKALWCYFHDSTAGVGIGRGVTINGCIFDTVAGNAVNCVSDSELLVLNNTFYSCGAGVYSSGSPEVLTVINNSFSDCTDGFKGSYSGTIQESHFFDYNNWYNNTRDMSWDNGSTEDNSYKGPNAAAVNPNFTDAANGDFSLSSGSGLIDAGFGIQLGVG